MKRLLLFTVLLILLVVAAIYIFIPSKITIHGARTVAVTVNGFDSCLHNPEKWQHWWPTRSSSGGVDSGFIYNGYSYTLNTPFSDGGIIRATAGNESLDLKLRAVLLNRDSIVAEWETQVPAGNTPFSRVSAYFHANRIKENIQPVFDSLCGFAGKTENIYGFPIKRTTFREVILLATRFKTASYPGTGMIYEAIEKLRQYITTNGAVEKYYPMMNTKQVDSLQYETMIAISIDKMIPAGDNFFISRMVPMENRFLETNLTGGPTRIEKARLAIEKYMTDHSLSSPARPFDILITDRTKEPDTTRWETKIFYPSM